MSGRDAVAVLAYIGAAAFLSGIAYRHGDVLSTIFGAFIGLALWRAGVKIAEALFDARYRETE
jgi:hypothetical protein